MEHAGDGLCAADESLLLLLELFEFLGVECVGFGVVLLEGLDFLGSDFFESLGDGTKLLLCLGGVECEGYLFYVVVGHNGKKHYLWNVVCSKSNAFCVGIKRQWMWLFPIVLSEVAESAMPTHAATPSKT